MTQKINKHLSLAVLSIVVVTLLSAQLRPARAQSESTFRSGLQRYFQEDYEEARKILKKAVDVDRGNVRYRFFLGNTYMKLDQVDSAIRTYKQVLKIEPGHQTARRRLANIYLDQKRWSPAIRHFKTLVKNMPDDFQLHYNLGRAYFERDELKKAQDHFLKAREIKPRSADSHFYYGRILMKREEYLNASSRFGRAIELDPNEGKYYFYKALANFREQDYLNSSDQGWKSGRNFEKALELGYDSPRAHFMRANSLLNRGLYYLKNNRDKDGYKLLKESITEYRTILASDWKASNAFHNMGVAYYKIGKLELARQAVEKAVMTEPTIPFFHDTLGEIYFQLGEFGKSIESWNLAQELDSSYDAHPFEPLIFNRSIADKKEEARIRR